VALFAVLATLTPVGLARDVALAHPAIPSAVFDPAELSWASVRNMTSSKFAEYFDARESQRYMVVDLEVDVIDGEYRVGAIFNINTDGRGWQSLRDLTNAEFKAEWAKARDEGMRLVDQETYVVGGKRFYAGVWVENREGYEWLSYRNVTGATFGDRFKRNRDAGFMPVDIEVYQTGSGMRYGAIWVENAEGHEWRQWRNLTSQGFSDKFDAYEDDFRMLDVESYPTGSGQRYAGIWIENVRDRRWIEARDLTSKGFANRWNRYLDEGYRLVDYEKYPSPSGPRYAGIWRQNSERPDWGPRRDVNSRITQELDDFDVPGISVAIAREGEILYRRGFGFADEDAGTWMDSQHVQRLASVSKAVAGVLTMEMVEAGDVALDDESVDLVPGLPAHHTHTVGQLVSNRGCVRHYVSGQDGFEGDEFDTALEAAEEFWDDALVCTPGDYFYSTHGYTILAAALEQVAGTPADQLLLDRLTTPFNLGTLRMEEIDDDSVRRAKIYSWDGADNDEVDRERLDWKEYGGGMESSALDLTGFGIKLAGGSILGPDALSEMWTPPNAASGYAYGWSTGTQSGRSVVGKDGAQNGARSYLRIYPDDEVVVSVLTNRRNGGHSATQLATDLGQLVLDWIDS
jgi:CubicO group peptidase (beta-lactamase class C family)